VEGVEYRYELRRGEEVVATGPLPAPPRPIWIRVGWHWWLIQAVFAGNIHAAAGRWIRPPLPLSWCREDAKPVAMPDKHAALVCRGRD